MKLSAIACIVIALGACQESKSNQAAKQQARAQVTPQVQACSAALGSFTRFVDVGSGGSDDVPFERIKEAVLARCIEDLWGERALSCMRDAKTSHDTFQCWNVELTVPQRDAVTQALGRLKK